MARLDPERRIKLEPSRMAYAINQIEFLDYSILYRDSKKIVFIFNGDKITLYPFTGWFTGKSITDGRGIENLIKQLKST